MSRISRLIRPRHPLFWLLVVLQALSAAYAFVFQHLSPGIALTITLSGLLVANATLSVLAMWRLWRMD